MEDVIDLLTIVIPAVVVMLTAYLLITRFLDREARLREQEVREKLTKVQEESKKTILPLRLQAYERVILFLERIHPNSMVMRLHKPHSTGRTLHADMLQAIREEYEHNMAQQMYMSEQAWDVVKSAKEETIKILNSSYGRAGESSSALEFSQEVFRSVSAAPEMPTEVALKMVKKEVQKLF